LSPRENGLLGARPGRPPKTPGPLALTATEEEELAKAKAGGREWVGPGVAAYMLGISKDALKKRRQRNEGLIPEHRPAKSNRQGAQYRWSSVVRCAGAERFQSDVLAQRLDDIVAALKKRGLEGLEQDLPWAYNHGDRLVGFASLHAELPARALTVLEALEIPWVSSEARQPFHNWAMDVLQSAAESVAKATD